VKVWVVTRLRFESLEPDNSIGRRYDEVMRVSGDATPEEVAGLMEVRYAQLYQPGWDGTPSTIDERARPGPEEGNVEVGHEPRMIARLITEDS
jgi:hypothetical protein